MLRVFPYPKAFQFGLASLDERAKHIVVCSIPYRLLAKINVGIVISFHMHLLEAQSRA
jgi:hypothetical protein